MNNAALRFAQNVPHIVTVSGVNVPVRIGRYYNVALYGADADAADNTAAFNAAIDAANANYGLVEVPSLTGTQQYQFAAGATLTTLTNAIGMVGDGTGRVVLNFAGTNGDCLVLNGLYKRLRDIYVVNNRTAALSARSAAIRIKNCAYGRFEGIGGIIGAVNNSGVMLEQSYDGSAADAYLLAHIGTWYNTFVSVQSTYLSVGANVGYGLDLYVNPNAVGVVNPTGQPAGIYSGTVGHNTFMGLNVESMDRCVNLDSAIRNTFMGGQLLGGNVQLYGRNTSSQNTFIGMTHNQWVTNANDFDSSCRSNAWFAPHGFSLAGAPYTAGNLGSVPMYLSNDDGWATLGALLRGSSYGGVTIGDASWFRNAGTPEGAVTATIGSMCSDVTNGELYIKKTGSGNTGWKLVTHA